MPRLQIGIIGETGQLARAIRSVASEYDADFKFFGRTNVDLALPEDELNSSLTQLNDVDVVINAAAYTAVDLAEDERDLAFATNFNGPRVIADYCNRNSKSLVHVSTDYVFDGKSKRPYLSDHTVAPLGVYGESKLAGEDAVKTSGCPYVILRTSWVYDGSGKNFMTTMLRVGKTRDVLTVVNDQLGRPTFAKDLARACIVAGQELQDAPEKRKGTYHFTGSGDVISWADFAREIFKTASQYSKYTVEVKNVPSSEYPTKARRPSYSALDNSTFSTTFGYESPVWQSSLKVAMSDWSKS
ncbi:MAG: dTDP-4-dehydrorhamnose reductase [Litorimonas sp.]